MTYGWYPVLLLSPPQVIVSVEDNLPDVTISATSSSGESRPMSLLNILGISRMRAIVVGQESEGVKKRKEGSFYDIYNNHSERILVWIEIIFFIEPGYRDRELLPNIILNVID